CPDWPGCFPGRTLPPLEVHALIEFSHRALVGIVTLLIAATAWVAWRRERRDTAVLWPAVGAVGIVLLQSAVGAGRIFLGPEAFVVTLHFMVAMALVAAVMVTATAVRISPATGGDVPDPGFRSLLRWALGATAGLLLLGAWVRGEGAGLVFPDWPLMDGRFVPSLGTVGDVAAFLHRMVAALVVVLGAALALRSRRLGHRSLRVLAWTSLALLLLQAGLGAAAVLTELQPWARAAHVTVAGLAWATLVALGAAVARMTPATSFAPRRRERIAAYTQVMKPDIIVLLLITTVPAMILAAGSMPPWSLVLATLLGGTLAAGGANAINCYLDRDIDAVMARTRGRPIPSHRVE
ncbi:MAG: COX15/CtaA family protein, partial [Acidimicrobiia bacterium]